MINNKCQLMKKKEKQLIKKIFHVTIKLYSYEYKLGIMCGDKNGNGKNKNI